MRVESPRFTPLRGRADDITRLTKAVRSATPLITVAGPIGVGKSRLVAHVVPPSAVWIDATPFTSADEIETINEHEALAAARGTRTHTGTRLVVLDGLDAPDLANALADYLDRHPTLQLIVTRRAPLRVRGETVIRLSPLAVPGRITTLLGRPDEFPAVACLSDHATRADPQFTLDDTTAEPILCVLLATGGNPLAIELAASWLSTVTIHELADRCDRSHELFSDAPTDLAPTHRELIATIHHSFSHLETPARQLAYALGLFASTATASELAEITRQRVEMPHLTRLVDLGLAATDTIDTETVFAMPAVIATAIADQAPAELHDRHRAWLLDTIHEHAPLVGTIQTGAAIDVLSRHVDSIPPLPDLFDPPTAAELALELEEYWFETGQSIRGIHHTHAVAASLDPNHVLTPWIDLLLIRLHLYAGHVDHAAELAAALPTTTAEPALAAASAHAKVLLARYEYRSDRGPLVEHALELAAKAPACGHPEPVDRWLRLLSARLESFASEFHFNNGNLEIAMRHAERSVSLAAGGRQATYAASAHLLIGHIYLRGGDLDAAVTAYREFRAAAKCFGRRSTTSVYATEVLAEGLLARGDIREAHAAALEANALVDDAAHGFGVAQLSMSIGFVMAECGDVRRATLSFLRALDTAEVLGHEHLLTLTLAMLALARPPVAPPPRVSSSILDTVRTIDPGCMSTVWEHEKRRWAALTAGQPETWTLDRALREARRHLTGGTPMLTNAPGGLSPREHEVIRRVANGCTDREIAEQLAVGIRTVQSHVAAILRKLGVRNRHEAAAWFRAQQDLDRQPA
jgi:DNA-binding CsgD family transcriptional regulator